MPDAFSAALSEYDIKVTPEQVNRVRGSSKRQAILSFIPEGPEQKSRGDEVYASFCKHLVERYRVEGIEPIDGAAQIFRELRERSIQVALNTGFDRDITRLLLMALNWQVDVVDAVVCGDDVRQGRPAPDLIFRAMEATGATEVQRVVNVGDTELDLLAGHNAGVRWNVGVLSGAHDRERLERAPHTHLFTSIEELAELFAEV